MATAPRGQQKYHLQAPPPEKGAPRAGSTPCTRRHTVAPPQHHSCASPLPGKGANGLAGRVLREARGFPPQVRGLRQARVEAHDLCGELPGKRRLRGVILEGHKGPHEELKGSLVVSSQENAAYAT